MRERETGGVVKVSLYARGRGRGGSGQGTQGRKERQLSRSQTGGQSRRASAWGPVKMGLGESAARSLARRHCTQTSQREQRRGGQVRWGRASVLSG